MGLGEDSILVRLNQDLPSGSPKFAGTTECTNLLARNPKRQDDELCFPVFFEFLDGLGVRLCPH